MATLLSSKMLRIDGISLCKKYESKWIIIYAHIIAALVVFCFVNVQFAVYYFLQLSTLYIDSPVFSFELNRTVFRAFHGILHLCF